MLVINVEGMGIAVFFSMVAGSFDKFCEEYKEFMEEIRLGRMPWKGAQIARIGSTEIAASDVSALEPFRVRDTPEDA